MFKASNLRKSKNLMHGPNIPTNNSSTYNNNNNNSNHLNHPDYTTSKGNERRWTTKLGAFLRPNQQQQQQRRQQLQQGNRNNSSNSDIPDQEDVFGAVFAAAMSISKTSLASTLSGSGSGDEDNISISSSPSFLEGSDSRASTPSIRRQVSQLTIGSTCFDQNSIYSPSPSSSLSSLSVHTSIAPTAYIQSPSSNKLYRQSFNPPLTPTLALNRTSMLPSSSSIVSYPQIDQQSFDHVLSPQSSRASLSTESAGSARRRRKQRKAGNRNKLQSLVVKPFEKSDSQNPPLAVWIEGRFFANTELFLIPYDQIDSPRCIKMHDIYKKALNGNFTSPIDDLLRSGARILEIGTGAGTWSLEMAKHYPLSSFTGIDINPDLFPASKNTPRNCNFKEHNILKKLPFADYTFDVIFCRGMIMCVPERKWQRVVKEFVRMLKPGGCLELVDIECCAHQMGEQYRQWNNIVTEALMNRGINPIQPAKFESYLSRLNLIFVQSTTTSVPIGKWDRSSLGISMKEQVSELMQSMRIQITASTGMSAAEYNDICDAALHSLDASKTSTRIWVAAGRRSKFA